MEREGVLLNLEESKEGKENRKVRGNHPGRECSHGRGEQERGPESRREDWLGRMREERQAGGLAGVQSLWEHTRMSKDGTKILF